MIVNSWTFKADFIQQNFDFKEYLSNEHIKGNDYILTRKNSLEFLLIKNLENPVKIHLNPSR